MVSSFIYPITRVLFITHFTLPLPLERGRGGAGWRASPVLIIQYSSCSLVSIVVVVLVDIRDRDAIGAGSVDELEITIALYLGNDADMIDTGRRTEEHQVAHVHIVAVVDGQSLTPLVTAAAAETDVERLIDKTGKAGTVKGVWSHAATTIRPADIILGLLDDLRTRNVEQCLQL